jgi:hypothetical protein
VLVKRGVKPVQPAFNPEEILPRANALFGAEQSKDLRGLLAEKIEDLRHYDVVAMQRVVAILMWGRSGSLLLASYLDGHDDVIMLPQSGGERLYEFFARYQSLPLRDKLIAYAAFEPEYPRFFDGEFAISSGQYYAAVQAILEVYGKWPPDFLESRRAFFLFVHIAYNLALGRRPASSNPPGQRLAQPRGGSAAEPGAEPRIRTWSGGWPDTCWSRSGGAFRSRVPAREAVTADIGRWSLGFPGRFMAWRPAQ